MKKDRWWNEASKSGEATSSIGSKPESLMTGMLLPFQRDGCKTAADTVTNREASENEWPPQCGSRAWEAKPAELEWSSDQPLDKDTPRRAVHRSPCAPVMGSTCRAASKSHLRRLACRNQSYKLDKILTETTSSHFAVQAGRSPTRELEVGLRLNPLVVCTA